MAIYYQDLALVPNEEGTELEQLYAEGLEEINKIFKENNGHIVLKRRDARLVWDKDNISYKPVPPVSIPVEIPMYLEKVGAINVRYSKSPPQRSGEKMVTYPGNRVFIYESFILTEKEKDLAWLLLLVSNFVGTTQKEIFYIDNPEEAKVEEVSKLLKTKKVDDLLLDGISLIYNLKAMDFIASNLGIDIDDQRTVQLKGFKIRETVVAGENNNNPDVNIEKFMSVANRWIKNNPVKIPTTTAVTTKIPPTTTAVTTLAPVKDGDIQVPEGGLTHEYLNELQPKELNKVAKHFEVPYMPPATKVDKISGILEAQELKKSQ